MSEANQPLYRALLSATPDMVLTLKQNKIMSASPGGFSWLDSSGLKRFTLPELFTESQYQELNESISTAFQYPDQRVDLSALVSPEQLPAWKAVGMQKPTQFEIRLVAIDKTQILCVLRDTTHLHFLEKQSTSNVMRDPLTGMRSHRSLMPVLEKALGDNKRFEGTTFSLIIIDIDKFSDINDQFGWDAGDEVLRSVANMLDQQKRSSDFLCRFGDDLFAMLLTETNAAQAIGAGHRIQRLCSELTFSFSDDPIDLTVCVGVAEYEPHIDKPQDLIQIAQDNLLIAISSGGNWVVGPV